MKKYGPLMKDAHKARKVGQDKFSSLVNESIRGVREIKTLGIKKNLIKDMRNIIKDVYEKSIIEIKYRKSYHMTNRLLKSLMEVGVFITCLILLKSLFNVSTDLIYINADKSSKSKALNLMFFNVIFFKSSNCS